MSSNFFIIISAKLPIHQTKNLAKVPAIWYLILMTISDCVSSLFFSSGVKHQSVTCDDCHQRAAVSGIRWKCAQCHDYDLCTGCYMEGKHNCDHNFLRYAGVQERRYVPLWVYTTDALFGTFMTESRENYSSQVPARLEIEYYSVLDNIVTIFLGLIMTEICNQIIFLSVYPDSPMIISYIIELLTYMGLEMGSRAP